MAIIVPSRFSLLSIVEDDFVPPKQKDKKVDNKNVKKIDEKKSKTNTKSSKNNSAQVNKNATQSHKKKNWHQLEWDGPKRQDSNIIEQTFEEDIQKAILLSKMEIEQATNSCKTEKKGDGSKKCEHKKLKKIKPSQFDEDFTPSGLERDNDINISKIDSSHSNLSTSHVKTKKTNREQPSFEELKGVHLLSLIEEKDSEIKELRLENCTLKAELIKVKIRNKQLCSIIGQGEMREKAEILADNEKLREVQTELTNEVALLHAQLEQMKSSASKTDVRVKDKRSKKQK